ncbi:M56 family metallopeptidase [Kovacikia minuta CCNUW1]|uniref:M56 family metallopeptidase n=1 Tax=Kovacikia minuta TaxID=2931930 RepID=UPI001CD02219|nr:M56 family metallopeptidase [Kovacikia minuta]UBF25361.1 M56 family metallopeptidase [Kovacikia minuta CCNUW1]
MGGTWQKRWRRALGQFLFAPLLLLMTAIALLCMGPKGQMVRWWEGWLSYLLAVSFLAVASILAIKLVADGWHSLHQVRSYARFDLQSKPARLLPTTVPFVAQIGFWQPELVVSQGLLNTFDAAHLEAVLTHEQAHRHYRDTFWFFWLGWLRRMTVWLPQTEVLWQELLLLREHRADRWAAQQVDSLLLAESLLQMVSAPELYSDNFCAAFSSAAPQTRLEERIEALLSEPESAQRSPVWTWAWLLLVLLPLASVPFHY